MRYTILCIWLAIHAQTPNLDVSRTITLSTFNQLVDKSIQALQSKPISQIPDSDQVSIMMCLNTIAMNQNAPRNLQLSAPNHQKLIKLSEEKAYTREITKVYPNWVPNRGMGFYFPKLKMELYGTPRLYAVFHVQH
jgi:hypothetical protein